MRLTQRELFPRVRRESESKDGHGGDEEAGHDQVEEVVEGSPPDPHHEGDVKVRLGTAVVDHLIPGSGHTCEEHIHFSSSAIENPQSALPLYPRIDSQQSSLWGEFCLLNFFLHIPLKNVIFSTAMVQGQH